MESLNRSYKKKTIENIIRNKMESWIKSLRTTKDEYVVDPLTQKAMDTPLQKMVRDNYIVTGGAIASMLLGEMPNDFDVYFRNSEVATALASHYLDVAVRSNKIENSKISKISVETTPNRVSIMIKSVGVYTEGDNLNDYDYFEMYEDTKGYFDNKTVKKNDKPYRVLAITSNAITLSDDVQLIFRFIGDPEEIHKNYDFLHATNYFTHKDGLVLKLDAVMSVVTKELRYSGSLYPICSIFRLRKFIKRGWTITAGEILKICYDVNKLDLDNPLVLKEQLVGVDQAYFNEVISILSKDLSTDKPLDRTYLFEVINRVFDDIEERD